MLLPRFIQPLTYGTPSANGNAPDCLLYLGGYCMDNRRFMIEPKWVAEFEDRSQTLGLTFLPRRWTFNHEVRL